MALATSLGLFGAGCGGAFPTGSSSGPLLIDSGAAAVVTGSTLRLHATVAATGAPAQAVWKVVGSDNAPALGSGSIAADGTYTPPGTLSHDEVTVTLAAASAEGESTTTVTVHPAFAQPLQPENGALAPGESLTVKAQLAEVTAGTVRWQLPNGTAGTLADGGCTHARKQFTTCTAVYTAPATGSAAAISLVAVTAFGTQAHARILLRADGLSSNPATHQAELSGPIALGVSGGNDNDFDTFRDPVTGTRFVADCCGGTLGALVEDAQGTRYALSNNHVLAISDQGARGDTVEQPGLIDDACVPLSAPGAHVQAVGQLQSAVPLEAPSTNVDAALASITPGTLDPSGAILEMGSPAQGALQSAPPTAGVGEALDAGILNSLRVAKSGRTTGLTCSTVDGVDLTVRVDYYKDCAETHPLLSKVFTGQVAIGGESFADAGDSGSLVLDTANARALGLLYATGLGGGPARGSGGMTLANPIGDVLGELGFVTGSPLSIVGSTAPHTLACLDYDSDPKSSPYAPDALSPDEKTRTANAVEAAGSLRGQGGVLAVAAGQSADHPGEGAVLVYVDRTGGTTVPQTIDGVRTVVISTDAGSLAGNPASWPLPAPAPGIHLTGAALARAQAAVATLAPRLVGQASGPVLGVGATGSLDQAGEPAVLVLLDSDASTLGAAQLLQEANGAGNEDEAQLPATLGGLRVRYVSMHGFRVTGSKYTAPGAPTSCSLRRLDAGDSSVRLR